MTLYEYLEEIYNNKTVAYNSSAYGFMKKHSFEDMLSDEKLCIELIKLAMEFNANDMRPINNNRGTHIFVTWLLGIGLGEHFDIYKIYDRAFGEQYYQMIWTQAAMLHDYGYFCSQVSKENLDIKELTKDYDLLADKYTEADLSVLNNMSKHSLYERYFSYTYDEIEKYYLYSQQYHKRKDDKKEKNDHGIVGACIAFAKYCKDVHKSMIGPSPVITAVQKISCFITASHNIFKSCSDITDVEYLKYGLTGLLSGEPIRVTKKNTVLLLLSLVDTIECTKRFSAWQNKKRFLKQKTVLKCVSIELMEKAIKVDYSPLMEHIKSRKPGKKYGMVGELEKHKEAVKGLSKWTSFTTEDVANEKLSAVIRL